MDVSEYEPATNARTLGEEIGEEALMHSISAFIINPLVCIYLKEKIAPKIAKEIVNELLY
jgi:hypothetical protein